MIKTEKQKRVAFSRGLKSRWSGVCAVFLVLALVIGSGYGVVRWMNESPTFQLKQLVIQGDLHYLTQSDIRNKLLSMGSLGSFLDQNVSEVQQELATMPWISSVSVRKQWPDIIHVLIKERQPLAIWNGQALVDEQGQVFNASPEALTGQSLVSFYGPADTSDLILKMYQKIEPILENSGFKIGQLSLNEWHSWTLTLRNGIQLRLGQDNINQRIERFIWLYPTFQKQGKPIAYVDLRYSNGAAVGWKAAVKQQ